MHTVATFAHLSLNEPCRQLRDLRSLTVAAFAVCSQPGIRPSVSKLPMSVCQSVSAWLIASHKQHAPVCSNRCVEIDCIAAVNLLLRGNYCMYAFCILACPKGLPAAPISCMPGIVPNAFTAPAAESSAAAISPAISTSSGVITMIK